MVNQVRRRFGVGSRGLTLKSVFACAHTNGRRPLRLETTVPHSLSALACADRISVYVAAFTSTITFTDAQSASAPMLEPAFEHLLRNSMAQDSIIMTLRSCAQRWAGDLGIDMAAGGLPHKRANARVVTARKTAKGVGGNEVAN